MDVGRQINEPLITMTTNGHLIMDRLCKVGLFVAQMDVLMAERCSYLMRCALSCFVLFTSTEFLHFMKASRFAPAGGVTVIWSLLDQISNPTRATKVLRGLYACRETNRVIWTNNSNNEITRIRVNIVTTSWRFVSLFFCGLTHHVDEVDDFKHPLSQLGLISLHLHVLQRHDIMSEHILLLSRWLTDKFPRWFCKRAVVCVCVIFNKSEPRNCSARCLNIE